MQVSVFLTSLEGPSGSYVSERINVYQAMCLQFANHVAEAAPIRRCESCGQLFVRKSDRRYRMGQSRLSGRKFSSDTCEDRYYHRRRREKMRQS
jgi:hypothetical protein